MKLNTLKVTPRQTTPEQLKQLVNCQLDVLHITQVIDPAVAKEQSLKIGKGLLDDYKFQLPDGYFFPLPYSAVHPDESGNEIPVLDKYFSAAAYFSQHMNALLGEVILRDIFTALEKLGVAKKNVLELSEGKSFSPFSLRMLDAGKNGILIHCENSFLTELAPNFREMLYQSIDIENALSVLIVLQPPDEGGELILFETDWRETPIQLNECLAQERHILNGNFFTNKRYPQPTQLSISPATGDIIIFRAAQIWHTVNSIAGNTNRITLGCFIAPDKNGELKYWA